MKQRTPILAVIAAVAALSTTGASAANQSKQVDLFPEAETNYQWVEEVRTLPSVVTPRGAEGPIRSEEMMSCRDDPFDPYRRTLDTEISGQLRTCG